MMLQNKEIVSIANRVFFILNSEDKKDKEKSEEFNDNIWMIVVSVLLMRIQEMKCWLN